MIFTRSTLSAMTSLFFFVLPTCAFLTSPESMACRVSEERSKFGLPPVGVLPELNAAAAQHAAMQSSTNQVFHVSADGSSTPMSRITAAGLSDWLTVGENAAGRFDKESEVMRAWIASPGHHQTILGPYNCMGSATVNGYWTQKYASIPNAGRCPIPRCKYNSKRSRVFARAGDSEDAALEAFEAKVADAVAQVSSFNFSLADDDSAPETV